MSKLQLIKFILFISLVWGENSFCRFDVMVKNRDQSIDGSRIKQRSIPYKNIKVDGQEEGDVQGALRLAEGHWGTDPLREESRVRRQGGSGGHREGAPEDEAEGASTTPYLKICARKVS